MIRTTEPSAATTGVGTTVTFVGAMPVAANMAAAADADTCSCTAAMTAASLPTPGGSANESVCVTRDVTISVNVTVTALPLPLGAAEAETNKAALAIAVDESPLGERTTGVSDTENDAFASETTGDGEPSALIAPLAAVESSGF